MLTPDLLLSSRDLGLEPTRSGKVRDIFVRDRQVVIVATDRISAFDVVLPNAIPWKGAVLTQITRFWNGLLADLLPNHVISYEATDLPAEFVAAAPRLARRTMLCRRCMVIPVECVVRGYLAGSGWKEYRASGTVCGIGLPPGLTESAKLPEPIFTPSTKAEEGHDENIAFAQVEEIVGPHTAAFIRDNALALYRRASLHAEERGIILADTKFEFGLDEGGNIILIDEVLTPDSSRFWPRAGYAAGKPQPSFDKQIVRDYLETLAWDKQPPGPTLPDEVVEKTSRKYLEIYELLTGSPLV